MTAVQHWRTTLRDALLAARTGRDVARVSELRSALRAATLRAEAAVLSGLLGDV